MSRLSHFRKDESGAVVTDWVVLTAGAVTLAIIVVFSITQPAVSLGTGIGGAMATITP